MGLLKMSLVFVIFKILCISLVVNDFPVGNAMDTVSDANGPAKNISSSDCFEVRLPDVFSIGKCIREQRDLCEEKCVNENLAGCVQGGTVDASKMQSIIHLEECIARDFFDRVPQDAIEDLFCDFLKNVQVTSAAALKAKSLLMLIFKDKCL
ncbi:hypothetical protein MTO96_010146 [Rhipicephalus appendiculatus]